MSQFSSLFKLSLIFLIMNKNYLFILFGAIVAIYANANKDQNIVLLVLGIAILMYGIFNLQKTIPSKKNKSSFIKSEPVDEEE